MAMDFADNCFTYKLVLLGETAVGKSSLVMRFVKDEFNVCQESTIGAAFFTQKINCDQDTVKFEIWDTAGQERYQSLAPMYYRNAKAAVVVYDLTDWASYERAVRWVEELQASGAVDLVIALAGNKADLADDRKVPTDKAAQFAQENNLVFMETSAKTRQNVREIFTKIAERMPRGAARGGTAGGKRPLRPQLKPRKNKGGCC